jgi:hypothetical protein
MLAESLRESFEKWAIATPANRKKVIEEAFNAGYAAGASAMKEKAAKECDDLMCACGRRNSSEMCARRVRSLEVTE